MGQIHSSKPKASTVKQMSLDFSLKACWACTRFTCRRLQFSFSVVTIISSCFHSSLRLQNLRENILHFSFVVHQSTPVSLGREMFHKNWIPCCQLSWLWPLGSVVPWQTWPVADFLALWAPFQAFHFQIQFSEAGILGSPVVVARNTWHL